MTHFRPYWYDGDAKQEDYLGAELINRDLRDLIEPYIEFLYPCLLEGHLRAAFSTNTFTERGGI